MKTCRIPHTDLVVSRICYGCASLGRWDRSAVSSDDIAGAARVIGAARDNGITFFDLADIYAFGKAETLLGEVLRQSPGLREQLVIQSKCGQRFADGWKFGDPVRADLSHAHIVAAVEGSLGRLRTDRLDILLLHLPDALVQPEEVAQAFDELQRSGKVRHFGVSNHSAAQIELLQRSVRQPIVVNQIHLGLAHPYALVEGMEFTLQQAKGIFLDRGYTGIAGAGTFEYCRLHDIQVQAWSPLRGELLNPTPKASPELVRTARLLAELAQRKSTTPAAVGLAWLLRHPAGILPITGAVNAQHIAENCAADRVNLSADEWYDLFAAACALKPRELG
jgi:predicted oxidoreductase